MVVELRMRDFDGKPVMASFVFRDDKGRVYPAQTRRLAPDFFFHSQVYRADGETVLLQPGRYTVSYTRGPEYLVQSRHITVPKAATHSESFALKRWVHPARKGWWSGDHHIHAAGCAHYESPTEGVTPADMMRHILGEDLNVGCCLSWGPCWYHQKRYFEGKVSALSTPTHLLRYDVEVSGFPSSHAGHICLLRLREQDYPGTKLINDWPSWDLPIFKWAKAQGAVVGFAHSGWGLDLGDTRELPCYKVPPFNGIGANEYIVDVTHGLCDFISTVDTPAVWELNVWYHTLNCGYRCRISGETDFPCIFGDRVGLGRSYVYLDGKLNFDDWAEGIKRGRCYVSDGKSHLMDFTVNGQGVGLKNSEVKLVAPGKVTVKATVAALLEPKPTPRTEAVRKRPLSQKPYWDVERARVGDTRKVPVEVVVNGVAVDKKEIVADGSEQELSFEVPISQSSWVCLRVFPSSHTNPLFVVVDGQPIRASKKSAEWCLKSVEQCWQQKRPRIRAKERAAAAAAYDHAQGVSQEPGGEQGRLNGCRSPPPDPLPEAERGRKKEARFFLPLSASGRGSGGGVETAAEGLEATASACYDTPIVRTSSGEHSPPLALRERHIPARTTVGSPTPVRFPAGSPMSSHSDHDPDDFFKESRMSFGDHIEDLHAPVARHQGLLPRLHFRLPPRQAYAAFHRSSRRAAAPGLLRQPRQGRPGEAQARGSRRPGGQQGVRLVSGQLPRGPTPVGPGRQD